MEKKPNTITYYDNVAGLRTFAAIGIVLMHLLISGGYALEGFLFRRLIPSFTDLVFLFMMISSFSMCCGYYEKMCAGNIDLERFYRKRFAKVWPFFALLTILEILVSPSRDALYEGFANLTLCFGLLPNARISVIGVGWTLGVIFVFYLLFPFFCFLMSDRRRRWLTMVAAILMNFACTRYFFDDVHVVGDFSARHNFLYCAVYFVAGGIIWHDQERLQRILGKWYASATLGVAAVGLLLYYLIGMTTPVMLVMYAAVLLYAVGRKEKRGLLNNRIVIFLSSLSMEIYLCHMVVFRLLEKMGLDRLFSNELLSYAAAAVMTVAGSVAFSLCVKWLLNKRHTPITK